MTQAEKLLGRLRDADGQFPWKDMKKVLINLGFEEKQGSGSRVKFKNDDLDIVISLHKPHPGNEVKAYAVKQVQETLTQEGLI